MPRRLTQEAVIERMRAVHGDRYDYSKVVYVDSTSKLVIVCSEHGEFEQSFVAHAHGKSQCPECSGKRRHTSAQWVEKAISAHGDRYDYSKVEYVNAKTRVTIICRVHGEFQQLPSNHLVGNGGCKRCSGVHLPTTEEWVERAREVHGDRYDYSLVEYVNKRQKVKIVCPEHGEFEQTPDSHVHARQNCPGCTGNPEWTTATWVEQRGRAVHGERYDYSLVEYVDSKTKVTIICREHGSFEQLPNEHATGANCPKCVGSYSPTTAEWIDSARAVHGDRYDYSLVEYASSSTKVEIICRQHGVFEQTPVGHATAAQGCPTCAAIRVRRSVVSRRVGTEAWIERARSVHGDRYDYSLAEYVNGKTRVVIICSEHGEFKQFANTHVRQESGCPDCADANRNQDRRLTQEEFISRAREMHGDRYDYSKAEYTGIDEKVTVICSDHGEFEISAYSHIGLGSGCKRHLWSAGEDAVSRTLDVLGVTHESQWSHSTCRDKQKLRFDFFLPEYGALIEFDGPQHFKPARWPGMDEAKAEAVFRGTQRRDRIKNAWAQANGYPLLRLWDKESAVDAVESFILGLETGAYPMGAHATTMEKVA